MRFLCLIDNLAQRNSVDEFGAKHAIVNLRGKAGQEYDSPYPLDEMFNAPGELPFWRRMGETPEVIARRGTYVSQPPAPEAKGRVVEEESTPAKKTPPKKTASKVAK